MQCGIKYTLSLNVRILFHQNQWTNRNNENFLRRFNRTTLHAYLHLQTHDSRTQINRTKKKYNIRVTKISRSRKLYRDMGSIRIQVHDVVFLDFSSDAVAAFDR